jgi:septal ring factor EnvC (AmiA/AmiB activator)
MAKPSNPRNADRDLEHRRAAARRTQTLVDQASGRLGQALDALAERDAQLARLQQAIAVAQRTLAENRQAHKALERDRPRLVDDAKQARKAAEKAQARATKAETRYERSVLGGLIQREKTADRAAHAAADGPISRSSAAAGTPPGQATGSPEMPELVQETTPTGVKITPA